jgi:hypothetical protein
MSGLRRQFGCNRAVLDFGDRMRLLAEYLLGVSLVTIRACE